VVVRRALRVRQVANWLNLSTPLGLLVARLGRAGTAAGPEGLVLARGYRLRVPRAPAFTVGNVVLLRADDDVLERRPRLLVHESRHATQYAVCLGPLLVPLYGLAAVWSWLRAGDPATYNVFERLAGIEDGGYRRRDAEVHDQRHG
jgi:hypothetical protein